MKFSIIMPVYNRESCVSCAISSVLEQKYSDWEMIIVDDGSTDQTLKVCRSFAGDSRIGVHSQENRGVSAARNYGLKLAAGDYIVFLDSDDRLVPETLVTLAETMKRMEKLDVICFGALNKDGGVTWRPNEAVCGIHDGEMIRDTFMPEHIRIKPQSIHFMQPFSCNKCFRRAFLEQHQILFDESRRVWEDNLFVVNCFYRAERICVIPDLLYQIGDSGNGDHLSASVTREMIRACISLYEEYRRQFSERYDFSSQYAQESSFHMLCDLMRQVQEIWPADEYGDMLNEVMDSPTVRQWAGKLPPKNIELAILRISVLKKKKNWFMTALKGKRAILKSLLKFSF